LCLYSPKKIFYLQEVSRWRRRKAATFTTLPEAQKMANWYLLRNGAANGPYPEEQVREWIRAGQIAPDEKLNREGDPNWLSLDMIPEFAAERIGAPATPAASPTSHGHAAPAGASGRPRKDRTTAGILALLLRGLGLHHFYLGNIGLGIMYFVVWLFGFITSFFVVGLFFVWIPSLLAFIEAIIFFTKPDDQFQRNCQNWFCTGA